MNKESVIATATHLTLAVIKQMQDQAKQLSLEYKSHPDRITIKYESLRTALHFGRQEYQLAVLVPMGMLAAILPESKYVAKVEKVQDADFIRPQLDYVFKESLEETFRALNKSLSDFASNKEIDGVAMWRFSNPAGLNESEQDRPFAHITNTFNDGSFTDINLMRDFIFYLHLQNKVSYEVKEGNRKLEKGGVKEYQYIGIDKSLHAEYNEIFRAVYLSVSESISPKLEGTEQ